MRKNKIVDICETKACPADKLMYLYRKNSQELKRNILFSKTSIKFFKNMADVVEVDKRIVTFFWNPCVEEELPSLKLKLQKEGNEYRLIYLKEKVNYSERQNEFKGRITLNINQSKLRKLQKGRVILNKKEIER